MIKNLIIKFILCFSINMTSASADTFVDKLIGLAETISPVLDYIPTEETLEPFCGASLLNIFGANSIATKALAMAGVHSTTIISTPAKALVAGNSGLSVVNGTRVITYTTPLVSAGLATAASVATTAYIGAKGVCSLSKALSHTHITNEAIPLVMWVEDDNQQWGETEIDQIKQKRARFVKTDEVIPAGTLVLSLGHMSESTAAHYPNYQGRGIIQLGRFFNYVYETEMTEEERGYAVVPANSLNSIYKDNYTHQFTKDTIAEHAVDDYIVVPSGTPFELHKLRNDGWAKIELADGWNIWVEDFSNTLKIDNVVIETANSETN